MARIEKSIEVNVPVGTAYRHMTQFEQFPRFMEGVQEVRKIDDTHLHWRTRSTDGEHEWDSEITEQVPDKRIAWRNVNGHANTGYVEFEVIGPDKTKLTLSMDIEPQGAPLLTQQIAIVTALHTEQNLARFKKMVEARADAGPGIGAGAEREAQASAEHAGTEHASAGYAGAGHAGTGHAGTGYSGAGHASSEGGGRYGDRFARAADVLQEPLVAMRKVGEEVDHLFERFVGRPIGVPPWMPGTRGWTPQVEVVQRGDAVVICADLPGVRLEDVQVVVRRDRLTIEGERRAPLQQEPSPQDAHRHRRSERPYGRFCREIPLPEGADPDAAAATMQDGVLEISLPLMPESRRARRLEIKTGR